MYFIGNMLVISSPSKQSLSLFYIFFFTRSLQPPQKYSPEKYFRMERRFSIPKTGFNHTSSSQYLLLHNIDLHPHLLLQLHHSRSHHAPLTCNGDNQFMKYCNLIGV